MKLFLAAAALIVAALPAHASEQTFTAPYPCATEEAARRTGVLVSPDPIPHLPGLTHGCSTPAVGAAAVWADVVADHDGVLTVSADALGSVCLFAETSTEQQATCAETERIGVVAGQAVTVGAVSTGAVPDAAVVNELRVGIG